MAQKPTKKPPERTLAQQVADFKRTAEYDELRLTPTEYGLV